MNVELERMWKESAVVYFKALSWTKENHETFRIVSVPAKIQIGHFPNWFIQDQVKKMYQYISPSVINWAGHMKMYEGVEV
jgi:hypothetical protein